mmetsp:Transcript_29579/g.53744  ORF Transcript_29579/g.53744 Transcript_29579/m.53744 type:complete len:204 (+) Transcript_29579:64-675(+)
MVTALLPALKYNSSFGFRKPRRRKRPMTAVAFRFRAVTTSSSAVTGFRPLAARRVLVLARPLQVFPSLLFSVWKAVIKVFWTAPLKFASVVSNGASGPLPDCTAPSRLLYGTSTYSMLFTTSRPAKAFSLSLTLKARSSTMLFLCVLRYRNSNSTGFPSLLFCSSSNLVATSFLPLAKNREPMGREYPSNICTTRQRPSNQLG